MSEVEENVENKAPESEYTDRQKQIAEKARQMFILGYHCSEAIIRVFNEEYNLNYNSKMIKMATGLGGGMGKAKCSCGTVTTGTIILSAIYGRLDLHDDDSLAFDLARELNERFKEKFKVTCCVVLTKNADWGHPNHISACSEYVYTSALILSDILDRCIDNFGDFRLKSRSRRSKKTATAVK